MVLFFSKFSFSDKSDNNTGVRKIELWFKNDDAGKRDDWIHEIYTIRTQIQEDAKTKDILDNNVSLPTFSFRF